MKALATLVAIVAAVSGISGQSKPADALRIVTVRDAQGQLKGFFQTAQQAYRPGSRLPLRLALPGRATIKSKDGRVVNGFAYYGWDEGVTARVRVLELVPKPGVENKYWWTIENPDPSDFLQAREFAEYTLSVNQTRTIDEMKGLGLIPMRLELKTAIPDK